MRLYATVMVDFTFLFVFFISNTLYQRAFDPTFEQLRKNLKKYVYQHDSIVILQLIRLRKFKRINFMFSS